MPYRNIIDFHYRDMCNLQDSLTKLTNSYRTLIGGANDLNGIALAKKGEVKDALKRADEVGYIMDDVISAIRKSQCRYLDYCVMYSNQIKTIINPQFLLAEIEKELCVDPNNNNNNKSQGT